MHWWGGTGGGAIEEDFQPSLFLCGGWPVKKIAFGPIRRGNTAAASNDRTRLQKRDISRNYLENSQHLRSKNVKPFLRFFPARHPPLNHAHAAFFR